jgi:tetratricopeptide (TPR) repeat protein
MASGSYCKLNFSRHHLMLSSSIQRTLPQDHDLINTAFSQDIARNFDDFCIFLSFGRRDEALMAIEEAVELRRCHTAYRPNTSNPDLAISLNHLASRLTDLGRREEALHTAEEAVKLCRQLIEDDPTAINPSLASSLSNLANCLSRLGFRKEALRAIQEAVEVYRPFAADNSTLYNGDLAFSLNHLAKCLSLVGCREDALRAVDEAVIIYRSLVVMCRAGLKALSPALPGPLRPGLRQGLARAFSRLGPGSRSRKPKARGSSPGFITN